MLARAGKDEYDTHSLTQRYMRRAAWPMKVAPHGVAGRGRRKISKTHSTSSDALTRLVGPRTHRAMELIAHDCSRATYRHDARSDLERPLDAFPLCGGTCISAVDADHHRPMASSGGAAGHSHQPAMPGDVGVELAPPGVAGTGRPTAARQVSGGGMDADDHLDAPRSMSDRSAADRCQSWYAHQRPATRRTVAVLVGVVVATAFTTAVLVAASAITSGSTPPAPPPQFDATAGGDVPITLLISFDGFRHDYITKADTPALDELVDSGVKATGLMPAFPSKTFPNHYTLVTGLYPESHGIVLNEMYDPVFNATFTLRNGEPAKGRWWGGEPIWATAGNNGKRSAALFWPGSEAEIAGHRPTYYYTYDGNMQHDKRVDQVIDWMMLPPEERPAVITMYFSAADTAGHVYGPDTPEVAAAVRELDRAIGVMMR